MNKMRIARKKPIEVWAMRYDALADPYKLLDFIKETSGETASFDENTRSIFLHKDRGAMELRLNNWLLFELNTDRCFYAIDEKIFFKTYEKVNPGSEHAFSKKIIENEYFYFSDASEETIQNLFVFVGWNKTNKEFLQKKREIFDIIQEVNVVKIKTLEGAEKIKVGEYLIRGIDGEFYPINSESFHQVYDIIN